MPKVQSITEWKWGSIRLRAGDMVDVPEDRIDGLVSRRLVRRLTSSPPAPEGNQGDAPSSPPPPIETARTEDPREEQARVDDAPAPRRTPRRTRKAD